MLKPGTAAPAVFTAEWTEHKALAAQTRSGGEVIQPSLLAMATVETKAALEADRAAVTALAMAPR